MRLLFIDIPAADVLQAKAALVVAGHVVELVEPNDSVQLRDQLRGSWDVIVVEWLTSPSTLEILQTVNDVEGEAPACIVWSAKATPANIEAAFRAGAEDFIKKPFAIEQLRGRLGRIAAQRECLLVAAARGDVESRTETSLVTDLSAWGGFQSLAAESVAGVTTLGVGVTAVPKQVEPWLGATMVLSVASARLECRALVDGDRVSLEKLADAAVGDSSREAIGDLLKEIVNTAGGAFMRSALDETVLVTSGLPVEVQPEDMPGLLDSASQSVVCWVADPVSGARLRIRLAVRVRRNRFVRVTSLREGMVLATDLRGAEGAVLLVAGTRVTSASSQRVRRFLDGRRMVEVADVAA